jgi:hypothetical protein
MSFIGFVSPMTAIALSEYLIISISTLSLSKFEKSVVKTSDFLSFFVKSLGILIEKLSETV